MVTIDLSLKLVVDFITRRQTGLNQITNWTNGIESWSLGEVTDLVATSPVAMTLDSTEYDLEITDYGRITGTDERRWQIYPGRNVTYIVADADEAAAFAHFDTYFADLRIEIQAFIDSNAVIHRATVERWHLHPSTGTVDEVVT